MSWFGWNGESQATTSSTPDTLPTGATSKRSVTGTAFPAMNPVSIIQDHESGDETDFFDVPEVAPVTASPSAASSVHAQPASREKRSKTKSKATPHSDATPARTAFLKLNSKASHPSPVIDFEGIDPPDQDGPDLQVVSDQVFNLTSRQFFEFFLSDQPVFSLGDFHALRGDKDILISHWSDYIPLSPEEQAKSKYPVDTRIKPGTLERRMKLNIKVDSSFSRLHKVQRLVPSPNQDGFLMITHAITPDVIFGTQFSVTDIWQLQDIPGQRQCRLQISLGGLFMNTGWAVTMLIPIIRSRIVSEGQEMWQHWSEVAKLRVSRLAHELMKSPNNSGTGTNGRSNGSGNGSGSGTDALTETEVEEESESDDLQEYTEDERQAARGGVGSISGVSGTIMGGAVFDVNAVSEDMQETLEALRAIELGEEVTEEERKRQEEIIKQQVREQQRMIAEKLAEKEKLKAKLAEQQRLQQEALQRQKEEEMRTQVHTNDTDTGMNDKSNYSSLKSTTFTNADSVLGDRKSDNISDKPIVKVDTDGKTHILFDPDAFILEDSEEDDDSTESDTDAAEVAQMTPLELAKHDKRVKRRLKDRRRRHQRRLFRAAKRAADADHMPSTDTGILGGSSCRNNGPLPQAVASNIGNDGANSKLHMSLAEIAAKEAKVAEELAVQNKRMCTRECKPAEYAPCTIM